jgi:ribonuclease Y
MEPVPFLVPLALGLIAAILIVVLGVRTSRQIIARGREQGDRLLDDARNEAEARSREVLVAAQEKALAVEEDLDRRDRELESKDVDLEARALQVQQDRTEIDIERQRLDRRQSEIARLEESAVRLETEAAGLRDEAARVLERTAGMSSADAKAELVASIEEEARREGARAARKIEDEARETAEREALQLMVRASERVSIRDLMETTVTFIELPSDEMKGRIIGREGRNIRSFENATGIDLIVDDTPRAILLSCFDPMRRHIARVAIERLVEDGRIHPARIEEVVERVRDETEQLVEETGTQAAFSLGMSDLHPKLVRRVGRMHYRTNHGQNLLGHCVEVAMIAGYMATEVGARVDVVHRAGLFHEIGRVDDSVTGHTALASAELASRYGESEEVAHAIQAMHPDVEAKTLEALLVSASNRISDNRPGARKDNLEVFIERLRRLESIARRHDGVTDAFAVKAGKEVRVLVDAAEVGDDAAYDLSKKIARTLETELAYPGQIKVCVVRQTRAVKFAV